MNFQHQYILENERALLRPLELADYELLISFAMNEPEIWKYSLVQAGGAAGLKNYIQLAIEGRNAQKEYPFIVFDKKTNQFAGSTRFYDIQLNNKYLQLGYTWYGKDFQGTGLNKQCKYLLLDFAFDTLGMERVEFRADNDNKRSIAAMHSIGCKTEGILRSNGFKPNGERRDSIVLSILKAEWENEVKNNLFEKLLSLQ
jgi:RimJ/RimL family protein N-acetyltransferase